MATGIAGATEQFVIDLITQLGKRYRKCETL